MLYESDINNLIGQWIERSQNNKYSKDYREALAECAFELQCTLEFLFNQEAEIRQYLDEQYADEYLATLEAHENLRTA